MALPGARDGKETLDLKSALQHFLDEFRVSATTDEHPSQSQGVPFRHTRPPASSHEESCKDTEENFVEKYGDNGDASDSDDLDLHHSKNSMSRQISSLSTASGGFSWCRQETEQCWPTYAIPHAGSIAGAVGEQAIQPPIPPPPLDSIPPPPPLEAIPPPPMEAGMVWPLMTTDWFADGVWQPGLEAPMTPMRAQSLLLEHLPTTAMRQDLLSTERLPPTGMRQDLLATSPESTPMRQDLLLSESLPATPVRRDLLLSESLPLKGQQDTNTRKSRSLITRAQREQRQQQVQIPPAPFEPKYEVSAFATPAPVQDEAPKQGTRLCTNCGGEVMCHFKFCRFCGLPLSSPFPSSNRPSQGPHAHLGGRIPFQ